MGARRGALRAARRRARALELVARRTRGSASPLTPGLVDALRDDVPRARRLQRPRVELPDRGRRAGLRRGRAAGHVADTEENRPYERRDDARASSAPATSRSRAATGRLARARSPPLPTPTRPCRSSTATAASRSTGSAERDTRPARAGTRRVRPRGLACSQGTRGSPWGPVERRYAPRYERALRRAAAAIWDVDDGRVAPPLRAVERGVGPGDGRLRVGAAVEHRSADRDREPDLPERDGQRLRPRRPPAGARRRR